DLELSARDKRERLQTAGQPIQPLVAKHRALVIDEREDDRFVIEVIAEPDSFSAFVAEGEMERNLFIQLLIVPDVARFDGARGLRSGRGGEQRQTDDRFDN